MHGMVCSGTLVQPRGHQLREDLGGRRPAVEEGQAPARSPAWAPAPGRRGHGIRRAQLLQDVAGNPTRRWIGSPKCSAVNHSSNSPHISGAPSQSKASSKGRLCITAAVSSTKGPGPASPARRPRACTRQRIVWRRLPLRVVQRHRATVRHAKRPRDRPLGNRPLARAARRGGAAAPFTHRYAHAVERHTDRSRPRRAPRRCRSTCPRCPGDPPPPARPPDGHVTRSTLDRE